MKATPEKMEMTAKKSPPVGSIRHHQHCKRLDNANATVIIIIIVVSQHNIIIVDHTHYHPLPKH